MTINTESTQQQTRKLEEVFAEFQKRDQVSDSRESRWYIIIGVALAAASAGRYVPRLYQLATESLDVEDEKIVQRRLKEAILKTSCLYGVPRSLQALLPLFESLDDERIDHFGPRYASLGSDEATKAREEKGRQYFDILWTPEAAEFHRHRNFKYQPDLYLLNLKMIYEWHFSEDTILSPVETQMCNIAALICSNSPVQAKWHTKGLLRHGGTIEDAQLAHDIGLAIAELFGCSTESVVSIEDIDFDDRAPH